MNTSYNISSMEALREKKKNGYAKAMTAWGVPEWLRLQFCQQIRDTHDYGDVCVIMGKIDAYSNAAGLRAFYEYSSD